MTTSQDLSVLSEIVEDKPIPPRTLRYFRRVLQNRFHELVVRAFLEQEKREGLNQKQLARRIGRAPEQVNRWLNTAGNWELDTLSDLLLGMKVDLDDPTVTPIADLVRKAKSAVAGTQPATTGNNVVSILPYLASMQPTQETAFAIPPLTRVQEGSLTKEGAPTQPFAAAPTRLSSLRNR